MFAEFTKFTVHGTAEPNTVQVSEIKGIAPSSRNFNGLPCTRIHMKDGTSFKVIGSYADIWANLRKVTKKAIPIIGAPPEIVDLSRVR